MQGKRHGKKGAKENFKKESGDGLKSYRKRKESGRESRNGNGKQEARIGFLMGDQRFHIIWGNTLGKWGINIQTRIRNGIIRWDVPVQGVDSLPKEVEVVT